MWHYIKAALLTVWRIIVVYYFKIKRYIKHLNRYPFEKRYKTCANLFDKVIKNLNGIIHIEGKENIPNGTCYFIANHQSFLDPLVIIAALKDKPMSAVAKIEVKKMPFVPAFFQAIEGLFIDRNDLKQTFKQMMKVQEDLEQKNKSWLIFPEGKRLTDPKMNVDEFHHGTFRPAIKSHTPIVPITIYGSYRLLLLKPNYKKYPIYLKIDKPIYPDEANLNSEQLAQLTHDMIESNLSFDIRRKDHEAMLKYNKKKYHNYH